MESKQQMVLILMGTWNFAVNMRFELITVLRRLPSCRNDILPVGIWTWPYRRDKEVVLFLWLNKKRESILSEGSNMSLWLCSVVFYYQEMTTYHASETALKIHHCQTQQIMIEFIRVHTAKPDKRQSHILDPCNRIIIKLPRLSSSSAAAP